MSRPEDRISTPAKVASKIGAIVIKRKNTLTHNCTRATSRSDANGFYSEDDADENPGHKVEWRRGGNLNRTRKGDREVEVLEEVHLEPLVYYPLD
jgi:hypothetical protein